MPGIDETDPESNLKQPQAGSEDLRAGYYQFHLLTHFHETRDHDQVVVVVAAAAALPHVLLVHETCNDAAAVAFSFFFIIIMDVHALMLENSLSSVWME